MINIELIREYHPKATNGKLFFKGEKVCDTIELPWKNNIKNISCIPEGTYQVVKRFSQKYKQHYLITNVSNRSLILIHPANFALKELKGCIAPVSNITGIGVGEYSKKAMVKLQNLINPYLEAGTKGFLIIKNKIYDNI
ncbi:DUF5675 family protein [Faecalibacter rhinopitheci]|uniref:DUF5675 domain-containing protein n=1 Tax=Faecalibacter rhinopitheci TaxID=2779678 RepID=A0A8J7FWQ1_9FLAO|nr:DUF5675 family protein [Faecalibacter rhinopitheci]MBF0598046.1 hypothetical protein [Faecalibacter rhinopitheci]